MAHDIGHHVPAAANLRLLSLTNLTLSYFLEDVDINPSQPPPNSKLVDEIRSLRRQCGAALRWEESLKKYRHVFILR